MKTAVFVACLLAVAGPAVSAPVAGRSVAVILDTSGSMQSSDPARYAVQITKILADLLSDDDELTAIRLPGFELTCSAGPSSSLALRLDTTHRESFEQRLDRRISYGGNNAFAGPVHTAIQALGRHPGEPRLLLMVADSGGLGACDARLTQELVRLHSTGALIAAVNLGSTAGAFDGNPAFDFTTPALDAHALIEAVGKIYQRFLGARKVQTGVVHGPIQVDIAPGARGAFLVVAADGPVGELRSDPGNPGARSVDLDYHGGGQTQGIDGRLRGYRIVHLERPSPGRWTFRAPDLAASGGWLLVQDFSSLGLRLVSPSEVVKGMATSLTAELYDAESGEAIRDPAVYEGLGATLDADGRTVRFAPDGQGHLTGQATFETAGHRTLSGHLESALLDQTATLELNVVDAAWNLRVQTPARGEAGKPLPLAASLEPLGDPAALRVPERIDAMTDEATVPLLDEGGEGDAKAGDRTYGGLWTPSATGSHEITYRAVGGDRTVEARAPVEVAGHLDFGAPRPLDLGPVHPRAEATGQLDLSSATVRGSFELAVSSDLALGRSALEIDSGSGWVPLGAEPITVTLEEGGGRSWPVRLRVGDCPEACSADGTHRILVRATAADGREVRSEIPLRVTVVGDGWFHCWWPLLALIGGTLTTGVVAYGFWSPSRFSPKLGVMLSPEEDIAEGYFHPIRAERGSGSGFYRDARIFVRSDFRLSRRPGGAVARLRAHGQRVRLSPMPGAELLRRTADDEWEPVAAGESSVRFGQLFRNGSGTLFFELRNG